MRPHIVLILALLGCNSAKDSSGSTRGNASASNAPVVQTKLPELEADPREEVIAEGVKMILQSRHLLRRPLDDNMSREAFEEYLERLDGRKLYLLESHIEELRKMSEHMDDQLKRGDLKLARQGEALLIERRKVIAKVVAGILEKPFDFGNNETVEGDVDKLAYCATEEALAERWRGQLELQVLQRVIAMERVEEALKNGGKKSGDDDDDDDDAPSNEVIPESAEGKEQKARTDLATSYDARFKRYEDRDPLTPTQRFVGAVAAVYDPHTTYLPPAEKKNFDIDMSGSLEGIGALLGVKDHLVEVRELVPGGASWRQGELGAGDLILAVTPAPGKRTVDITDMSLDRVVDLIRGPKDTVVKLRVRKPDGRIETIAITRDVIVIEAAYARGAELDLGGGRAKAGYINLPGFYGNTRDNPGATSERNAAEDVRQLLVLFEKRKLPGAILDLRGNGGGLLAHARDITGHLIKTGPVVQVRSSDGTTEQYGDKNPAIAYSGHVVVLVDRFSASASEIVAGALQDYGRAVVIGTGQTHGKGTVQTLIDLNRLRSTPGPSLGIFKLTTQQYFLVDGDSTQWRGVKPDIVLPDPAGYVESGERYLDHAIAWSETNPLPHNAYKAEWSVAKLLPASSERLAEQAVFKAIIKRTEQMKKRRDETLIPLEKTTYMADRKRDRDELAAVRKVLRSDEVRFQVAPIEYAEIKNADDPRIKSQAERWRKDLSRDPWVAEAVHVLNDMGLAPSPE